MPLRNERAHQERIARVRGMAYEWFATHGGDLARRVKEILHADGYIALSMDELLAPSPTVSSDDLHAALLACGYSVKAAAERSQEAVTNLPTGKCGYRKTYGRFKADDRARDHRRRLGAFAFPYRCEAPCPSGTIINIAVYA